LGIHRGNEEKRSSHLSTIWRDNKPKPIKIRKGVTQKEMTTTEARAGQRICGSFAENKVFQKKRGGEAAGVSVGKGWGEGKLGGNGK